MNAIKALMGSEKGFMGCLLFVAATIFVIVGKMSVDQWQEYTLWSFGIYAGAKTATSVATTMVNGKVTEVAGNVVENVQEVVKKVEPKIENVVHKVENAVEGAAKKVVGKTKKVIIGKK